MDSLFSFPVGLFHPLQHAGLSRRTPPGRQHIHNAAIHFKTIELLGSETKVDMLI